MAWVIDEIAFAEDAATPSWNTCDTSLTDYDKSTVLLVSAWFHSADHTPGSKAVKLRWRNKTDNPTGSFADLVTGSGELRAADATGLTNGDPVGVSAGCQTADHDEEIDNESPLLSGSFSPAKNDLIETQWAIDMSNGHDSDEYEFELYDNTGSASLGTYTYTVTLAAGLTHYDLVCDGGTFAYSGSAAGLEKGYHIDCPGPSAFAYTGSAAALKKGYHLDAGVGAYPYSGAVAGLLRDGKIVAAGGTFAYAGSDVTMNKGRLMPAATGAFPYTGSDVSFPRTYKLSAAVGSFPYSGSVANLERGYHLDAGVGAFGYSGSVANLEYGRVIQALAATFAFSGSDAAALYNRLIDAGVATFPYTGSDATLTKSTAGYTLDAVAGAFPFIGSDVTLTYSGLAEAAAETHGLSKFKFKKKIKKIETKQEIDDREIFDIVKQIVTSGILE